MKNYKVIIATVVISTGAGIIVRLIADKFVLSKLTRFKSEANHLDAELYAMRRAKSIVEEKIRDGYYINNPGAVPSKDFEFYQMMFLNE